MHVIKNNIKIKRILAKKMLAGVQFTKFDQV